MSTDIEVIPTVKLDWKVLQNAAGECIEIFETLQDFTFQVTFRGKSFEVLKIDSRDDFEVHSPVEYLDEKHSNLIDIEYLARGWKMVGCSYRVAPKRNYEDRDFVDLVAMIAEATEGVILNLQGIWSWSVGLATPQELITRSSFLQ